MSKITYKNQIVPGDATQKYNSVFLPWHLAVTEQTDAATTFESTGTGDPVTVGDINSSLGFTGFAIAADGDLVSYMWLIPYDCQLDGTLDMSFHVWSHAAAASSTGDQASWTLQYKAIDAAGDTLAAFTTTTGVTDTLGIVEWTADDAIMRSGAIALDVSAATTIDSTTKMLLLHVICDDIDNAQSGFATNEQNFLGLEIIYGRKFL